MSLFTGRGSDNDDQLSLVQNEAGLKTDYDSISGGSSPEPQDLEDSEPTAQTNVVESDEADTEEPITPLTISVMVFLTLAFIGQGMSLTSLGPTLLDLRQIASISLPDTAWLFISQSIGFFFGGLIAKPILQRFDNEMSLGICLLIQSICTVFVASFGNMVLMCILLAAQGFGIGFVSFAAWIMCARLGGRLREGMFLQAIYLGQAIGNIICPMFAHPFLSAPAQNTTVTSHGRVFESLNHLVKPKHGANGSYLIDASSVEITRNNESTAMFEVDGVEYLASHVQYYYIIQALIILIPSIAFMLLYCARDKKSNVERKIDISAEEPCGCSMQVFAVAATLLVAGMLFFGVQDTYSNLIPTFAVISPLHDLKFVATYLPSSFWVAVAGGRLIGIFVAKGVMPVSMLLVDTVLSILVLILLNVLGGLSELVLWMGTVLLGLAIARMSASSVAAISTHLPGNSLFLTMVTTARCLGIMIIPSTAASAMKNVGAMSLMYSCIVSMVLTLLLLIIAQIIVRKFGDSNGRVHVKK